MIDKLARAQARIVAMNADIADPDKLRDAHEFLVGTGDASDAKFAAMIANVQWHAVNQQIGRSRSSNQ